MSKEDRLINHAVELLVYLQNLRPDFGYYDHINNSRLVTEHSLEQTVEQTTTFGTVNLATNVRILKPHEVVDMKLGSCWDLALFNWYHLKQCHCHPSIFFVEFGDTIERLLISHVGVMFTNNYNRLLYWFEWSWKMFRGINGPWFTSQLAELNIKKICSHGMRNHYIKTFNVFDPSPLMEQDMITYLDFWNLASNHAPIPTYA
jgi:hypothetical protein